MIRRKHEPIPLEFEDSSYRLLELAQDIFTRLEQVSNLFLTLGYDFVEMLHSQIDQRERVHVNGGERLSWEQDAILDLELRMEEVERVLSGQPRAQAVVRELF